MKMCLGGKLFFHCAGVAEALKLERSLRMSGEPLPAMIWVQGQPVIWGFYSPAEKFL